jgi:electron transport complex protein RnfG
MNKRIVHDALILTAFTLVLGFILALVQGITAEPIDKANKAAAQKAYQAVFSDAKSFEKYDYDADEADKLVSDAGYKDTIDDIETALDSNKETLGYVITVTAKDGSQGSITFSVGIKNDGTVNGYSITSISETPGLGMKAEEADFYKQFENKKVDKFDVVKATPSRMMRLRPSQAQPSHQRLWPTAATQLLLTSRINYREVPTNEQICRAFI